MQQQVQPLLRCFQTDMLFPEVCLRELPRIMHHDHIEDADRVQGQQDHEETDPEGFARRPQMTALSQAAHPCGKQDEHSQKYQDAQAHIWHQVHSVQVDCKQHQCADESEKDHAYDAEKRSFA